MERKKITETQGRKEDTKDKARLDEALILKCLFQPKPSYDSVKGASIHNITKPDGDVRQ